MPHVPRMLAINAVARPGGAEIGLERLITRLHGWQVTVVGPDTLPLGEIAAGKGARALASFPRADRMTRHADVVYFNGTVAARALPAVRHAKTILHVHDLVDRVPRHWHRADVVLADSEAVADRLHPLDAHVVFCPVETTVTERTRPWGPGPTVGYIGRIEPRKGVLDLVRAAPAIDARVVLVGDDTFGADRGYGALVTSCQAVEHHGWVDDAAGLMPHLDVLVLPSYAEPFGTVLAEAMAAGTPVVATTVGGLPEVVTDGVDGVLVPPGRPDALAEGVARVLARRDEMGAAAKVSAQRFDADAYARRVEALITP